MTEELVRDHIPAIATGRRYRVADPVEMPRLLMDRLRQVAHTLIGAERGSAGEIEAAADMLTVAGYLGLRDPVVDGARQAKDRIRGVFDARVVMLDDEREAVIDQVQDETGRDRAELDVFEYEIEEPGRA
jgi:hypothetical protein